MFNFNCAELICNFIDQSVSVEGTVNAWSCDFGDGNNSTSQSPAHTFVAVATYTVSLTVEDNSGADGSVSHSVTVNKAFSGSVEVTFVSIADKDIWVRESGENTNVGGAENTKGCGSKAIRIDGYKKDR